MWEEVFPSVSLHSIQNNSFIDDFLDFFLALSLENRELVVVTIWAIWNNKNNCIYNLSCFSPDRSIRTIRHYMQEYRATTAMVEESL